MKKFLLSLMLLTTIVVVNAQNVLLNEIYGNPGAGNSEFIELYNSSASGSLDCYTILSYFENEGGTNKGWYVLDLPNTPSIAVAPGFYILAPTTPFSVQGTAGAVANVDWNAIAFRNESTGGYLKKYEYASGTNAAATYTDALLGDNIAITNLLDGTLSGGQFYFVLLYKNGVMINGFVGGGSSSDLSSYNIPLGTLPITPLGAGGCGGEFNAFGGLIPLEFWNPSGGNDNGYARTSDGACGSWIKTANQVNHTPGTSNGALNNTGSLSVNAFFANCGTNLSNVFANFSVTAGPAESFPVTVEIYEDLNLLGVDNVGTPKVNETLLPNGPDAGDPMVFTQLVNSASATVYNGYFSNVIFTPGAYINWNPADGPRTTRTFYILFKTPAGCFDDLIEQPACATLPVNLKSFTAVRNRTNVLLKWETANEEKNRGFDVQRFIGSGNWESVGFVSSKATDGNSSSVLNYDFNDINNISGITQYRLKLVDMDGKSSFSMIRSIRGEGQNGKTIVYPNPSGTGKVNVIFEDVNVTRDVLVIDMNGRTIKQWRGTNNNNIQIDNLNAGFYTLRIINKETGEQTVEKLIINKR